MSDLEAWHAVDERYVPGHGDARFSVRAYDLALEYVPETNRLSGRATLTVVVHQPLRRLSLDLHRLRASKVTVGGRRARHDQRGHKLVVTPQEPLGADAEVEVAISYAGTPRPVPGPDGEAGWEELEDGSIVASQPHGAPSWFPCNDRPSDKASDRFEITAPQEYAVVANGEPTGRRRRSGSVTWTYESPEPMAPYLATVHVGRFESVEVEDALVPLHVVAPLGDRDLCLDALADQDAMMRFFVDTFGPYPFGRYSAVVTPDELEIPLEAQGLSIFGRNVMTDEWSAQRLVAHELAHQWFGNSVTLASWKDIWLHEGFACYAEWLWSEESGHETADEWAEHHHERLADLPQDLLLGDPGPDHLFDDRVYKRGALTLHAVRRHLGDDAFFGLLRTWTQEHRHGVASTQDFVAAAGEAHGEPVDDLLDPWLSATDLPDLPPA